MNDIVEAAPSRSTSLVVRTAQRFGVDADKLMVTLKATAFKTDKPISNETMMALLIVADQYKLNPFTKELYAFPDKRGGIVPVVSIDGWIRIVNEHPQYDGCLLEWLAEPEPAYRCTMYRKDRMHPIVVTEYMAECNPGTEPWRTHPRRMLRHKAFIQGARVAFGFAGIYDEDEAERIAESRIEAVAATRDTTGFERIRAALRDEPQTVEVVEVPSPEASTDANLQELLRNLQEAPDEESAALVLDEGKAWVTPEQHLVLQRTFASLYSKEGSASTSE